MSNAAMNDMIRRAARARQPGRRLGVADAGGPGIGGEITPDADQGRRSSAVLPPLSMLISDRIRRAAGMSVRPGHSPVPEVGY